MLIKKIKKLINNKNEIMKLICEPLRLLIKKFPSCPSLGYSLVYVFCFIIHPPKTAFVIAEIKKAETIKINECLTPFFMLSSASLPMINPLNNP